MRCRFALFIAFALCGCDQPEAQIIPVDRSTGFRDGYLVEVRRDGALTWNGQDVDDQKFASFLLQYSALPKDAGRLWIEFEPNSPRERIAFVRERVVASGLCSQKRCVEGLWGIERPVVN
jgi:hypothetical protein